MSGWRRRRCFRSSSAIGRAEASVGVPLGFDWGTAAAMLGLGVRVISVLQAGIAGTDCMTGLRAWRHGRGTGVRGQVLGCRHGHETHTEMATE